MSDSQSNTDQGPYHEPLVYAKFNVMKAVYLLLATSLLLTTACSTTSELANPSEGSQALVMAPPPPPPAVEEAIIETAPARPKSQVSQSKVAAQTRPYFDWPVDEARMSRGFLPNRRRPHLGIDLAAKKGTPILASHDGTVIYTGRDFKGFGKMIMIEGSRGWATLYAHLSAVQVKEGQKVRQGEVIGGMGRTGRASGVHLHFEIRSQQGPIDPLLYLPGGRRLARQ
jgi:murein DD-endopeptidase MepM/ murein hydrolase activator NlpD